jgi:hypothetical protein
VPSSYAPTFQYPSPSLPIFIACGVHLFMDNS